MLKECIENVLSSWFIIIFSFYYYIMGLLNALFGDDKKKESKMGIFGEAASPFDDIVERVTAETLTSENWSMILDICDKVNSDPKGPKLVLLSIRKRLNHRDPHVIMLALSLLDSCWSNCGPLFRKEVSSAAFINEMSSKATCSMRPVAEKARLMIKKWVETECKNDSSLSLVDSLYRNLASDGHSFESSEPKKKVVISNDPNVVHSQEEEDDIAKAIALSLQEEKKQKPTASSLYPNGNSVSNGVDTRVSSQRANERTVRALYDFEAAEDNEISFITGDLITVTDSSNPNWWSGRIGVQQGLFPSSFVTSDLSEVKDSVRDAPVARPVAVIDESTLLKCIQLLEDCDPTGETPDHPDLAQAEASSMAQAPLIDARIDSIDRQSTALAQVDMAIRDVLALYDQAVQSSNVYSVNYQPPVNVPSNTQQSQSVQAMPQQQPYAYTNGMISQQSYPQYMMGQHQMSNNLPPTNQPQQMYAPAPQQYAGYAGYPQAQDWNQQQLQ